MAHAPISRNRLNAMGKQKVGIAGILLCLCVPVAFIAVELHEFALLRDQELFQVRLLIVASTTVAIVSGYYFQRLAADFIHKIENGIDR